MTYEIENTALEISSPVHRFGGSWTSEKLKILSKYLNAYVNALKKQSWCRTVYIDAFAGTGFISTCDKDNNGQFVFENFKDESAERFIDGSARCALQTDIPFDHYLFIEKDREKINDLERLKETFPDRANSIKNITGDANEALRNICRIYNWKTYRAVLFLDPYGMQVEWNTLKTIADTKAIDLWYLFPLGVGVNRLLTKNGIISSSFSMRLDKIFGDSNWYDAFYEESTQLNLFSGEGGMKKTANFDRIEQYFVERLRTIFPIVAENPYRLYNSTNNPLYSFCFAAANGGKGGKLALKIANQILSKNRKRNG